MAGPEIDITIKMIFYAVIGGFLPALIWLWFWLHEDSKKPEPNGLIIKTFVFGGLAVVFAFVFQKIFTEWLSINPALEFDISNPTLTLEFILATGPFFTTWAFIEELVKFGAVYIAIYGSKYFDEPVDGMIYMITAALGFAAVENSLFLLSALGSGESNLFFVLTGNLRFLGATLVHIGGSAVLGAAIALSFCKSPAKKFVTIIGGLILATILHGAFNLFIIITSTENILQTFLFLWIGIIVIIVFFERVKTIVCHPSFKNRTPTLPN